MTETTVTAGGWEFRVIEEGSRGDRPVLLLHGFPESAYEWRAQQGFLAAAGFRSIAPDQRGYSAGARPAEVPACGPQVQPILGPDQVDGYSLARIWA